MFHNPVGFTDDFAVATDEFLSRILVSDTCVSTDISILNCG